MTPAPARSSPAVARFFSLLILCAAAIFRFYHLGAKSIWLDEGMSIGIARLPWTQFAKLIWAKEANMSAYYVILHFWLKFGSSEFYVRSLSVLFSVAGVAAVGRLGKELFREPTGWIASALLAVNAWDIAASQEARGYSLAMLALSLSTFYLVRILKSAPQPPSSQRKDVTLYALLAALAVYSHFYSALVIGAQLFSIPFVRPTRETLQNLFRGVRLFVYLSVPLVAFVLLRGHGPMGWLYSLPHGQLRQLAIELTSEAAWPLQILFAAALAGSIVALIRSVCATRRAAEAWRIILAWSWLVLPVAIVLAVSAMWRPLFFPRYLIVVLPGFVLVTAAGLAQIKPNWLAALATVVVVGFSLQTFAATRNSYFEFGRDDWRSAARRVFADARPDDAAIFLTAPGRLPFEYYRSRFGNPASPGTIYPAHSPVAGQIDYRDFEPEPLAEVFQILSADHARVWLLIHPFNPNVPPGRGELYMRHWCETHYNFVRENQFNGVDVLLYSK